MEEKKAELQPCSSCVFCFRSDNCDGVGFCHRHSPSMEGFPVISVCNGGCGDGVPIQHPPSASMTYSEAREKFGI